MGALLMTIALILPVAAGVLRWPWWTILVCGAISVLSYFLTRPGSLGRLYARGDPLFVVGWATAGHTTVCAVLFALGRLLRMI